MEFRDAVRHLRSELGLTQVELAAGLKVNPLTVGRWENGRSAPNRSIAAVLLEYARARGASQSCLELLAQSIVSSARDKLGLACEGLYSVEHASLRQLIDDADFPIFVCDMQTDQLLYLNQKANDMLGSGESAIGRLCYECLMHRDQPCEFCHKNELVADRFTSYELRRPLEQDILKVRGKRILWNGREAHVRYVNEPGLDSQLKRIVDQMNGGISVAIYGDDGSVRLAYANERYYSLLGYTKEQFTAEVADVHDTLHPDDYESVGAAIAGVKSTGQAATFGYRVRKRDGSIAFISCSSSLSAIPGLGDKVLISVLTDVTAAVAMERQALVSAQRLDAILSHISNGVVANLLKDDGSVEYVFVSDKYYAMLGYTREQYRREVTDPFALVSAEDAETVRREAAALRVPGESKTLKYRALRRDGRRIWLKVDISIMRFSDVDMPVQLSVFEDITDAVEAEDKLRVNEEMLRIAAESDKRALVTYDVKANACYVGSSSLFSAKFGEVFSDVPDSLLEKGVTAPESADELRALFQRIRAGEPTLTVSLRLHTGHDEYQWFECRATTVFDAEGSPDKAVLVLHDITEQLLKEAVFKRWQKSIDTKPPKSYTLFRCNLSKDASIDQRNGELLKIQFTEQAMTFNNRTREYAEQYVYPDDREAYAALLNSDALLAMFYRGEHEAAMDYREVADSGELRWRRLSVELVEYLNSTDIQAFLMYEDINEKKLAEIKAKEEAESDPLTGAMNRAAFASKIEAMIYREPGRQHALLMMDMDGFKLLNDKFGHAVGDQALIDTVATLRSLIRDGDHVCRLGGDEFLIWLHDLPYDAVIGKRAQQMCEQVRKAFSQDVQITASLGVAVYPRDGRNFDELYRNADKALYKVKNAGKGSFAFYSAAAETDGGEAADEAVNTPAPMIKAKRRMLIVEDNELNRELLTSLFDDEYLIETAKNGTDAMIRLRHFGSAISVVLLDLLMPKMDGFEVLSRMQSNVELQAIPVIIVSGDATHETLLKAIESGAADYVTKPVDASLIRSRVKSAVSKADNERLRAQNSYLQLQRAEEVKFHLVLESTGTVVVEYDWRNHVFIYDNTIGKHIAGDYENRSLWKVFLSDMVADSADVKLMQEMLLTLANDRERSSTSKMVMLKTPGKQKHWFRVNVYKQVDDFGLAEKMIITFNDVHEEVLANEKLLYQATRDELTGLYNRAGFLEKAAELIAAREPGYYVLALADIEKFKFINDQYGTEKGDEVLRGFADVISQLQEHGGGICCRVMADSFAMLYAESLLETATLVDIHRASEVLDGSLPRLKIYVGRCLVDDKSLSVSALLDRAAIAKETVKGRYDAYIATFDDSMRTGILHQQRIISQMNSALQSGQFEVWFQPQYDHSDASLSGAEALVRWRHPEDGLIPPGDFIPLFERNGFIYELGKYVWESTCASLRKWIDAGIAPVPVSVNISRYDVFRSDLVDVIQGLVEKYSLPASMLRLEITESAFSESAEQIIEVVKRLISLGFAVEIDDFGSGYSSLNTLKDVPAQTLKMDMRFFENSRNSRRGGNIIESVVRMAKWLGMSVIAEGVEEKEQADYLKSVGCSYIQGYYYAKPMPLSAYEALLCQAEKTPPRTALETLDTLDNNEFWNPKSMETLVFNSYVGGACVFELHNGVTEVLRFNKEYAQIFSGGFAYDTSSPSGKTLGFMDDADRAALTSNVRKAIETRKPSACEICLVDASGNKKYLRVTVRLIARTGDRYLFYCVLFDITEQRMAERKEHAMAQQLQTIMGNIHGGISAAILHDKDNLEIVFTNDGFYEMFGYTRAQLEAELPNILDLILPEDRVKTMETVERIVRVHGSATYEYRCRKRDGSIIWVQVTNSVVEDNQLGRTVLLAVSSDVTELRRAQESELQSVDKLRAVMDHAGNGITAVAMEANGPKLLFVNDKFYEIVGYTEEGYAALTHGDMFKIVHPEEREQVRRQVLAVCRPGDRETIDYRIFRQDGSAAWVRAIVTITTLTGVQAPVQVAVFSDITEEMEAGAQLRFLNESARELLAQPDSEQAIRDTLRKLVAYFGADRGYVVELDHEKLLSRNSYELCAEGVASQMEQLQAVPFSSADFWYASLMQKHYFILEDIDRLDETQAALRALLSAQGIRSMVLAPLWRDGALLGFAGVDNPTRAINQLAQLTALSDYIAVLLTRRDLSRRIARDAEMLRELSVRLLDNLPHGAALYRFHGKGLSVVHINKRYWELVEREPVAYENASVFEVLHPDDRDIAFREIEAAIRQGRAAAVDLRIRCGQAAYKPFHVVANISRETDGSYLLYTSYTPITEQSMSIQEMIPIAISTMMSASSNISYVKDRDMRYICCSQSLASMLGCESDRDIIGKSACDFFEAKYAERFDADDRAVLASGKPVVDATEYIPARTGELYLASTSKYPLLDASGSAIGVYCQSIDITAQREKESQLELLTSSIPGGLAAYRLTDQGPRILFFNDGFYAFSGCTREEYAKAAEADAFAFVFEEDKPVIEAVIRGFLEHRADGRTGDCVFRCHTKAGGYRWLSMKTVLSKVGEEQFVINAVLLDITDQQEAQERLRVSEELNRLAIEHSGSIIARFDVQTRTLTLPERFTPIYEVPRVLYNMPQEQIALGRISQQTAGAYTELFESIIRGEATGATVYQQHSTMGWRWLDAQFTTVFSSGGEPVSAVITFSDVTERLEKEVVYTKWQQSIVERPKDSYTLFRCNLNRNTSYDIWEGELLSVRFDDTMRSFNDKTAAYAEQCVYEGDRDRYVAFVNADTMLAEYYRNRRSDSIEYREQLPGGAIRWLKLSIDLVESPHSKEVEAFLLYENIDEQKKAELEAQHMAETDPLTGLLNRQTFSTQVNNLIRKSRPGVQHAFFMLDIDGFKLLNDSFGHAAGDEALVEIAQKLKALLRKGDVLGRLGGDEFVLFLSSISGEAGIENKAELICKQLLRVYSTEVQISASIGIALYPRDGADSHELYEKADTALYAAKESGRNTFRLYSGVLPAKGVGADSHDMGVPPAEPEAAQAKIRRMLIVEDSKIDRMLLKSIFEKDYLVDVAVDGASALSRMRYYGPALSVVLLDLNMKGLSGFDVLEKAQSSPEMHGVPIIVVSGENDSDTCMQAIRSGAADFVTKPVQPELIRLRIRAAISRAEHERQRTQNSFLQLRGEETSRYQTALNGLGMFVVELDWLQGTFLYDSTISRYLRGTYDDRSLWRILLSDMVAGAADVRALQDFLHKLADDHGRTSDRMEIPLATPSKAKHRFQLVVEKVLNAKGLTQKLIMTFKDLDA